MSLSADLCNLAFLQGMKYNKPDMAGNPLEGAMDNGCKGTVVSG